MVATRISMLTMLLATLGSCSSSSQVEESKDFPAKAFRQGFIAMCACPSDTDVGGLDASAKAIALADCMNERASTPELREWLGKTANMSRSDKLVMIGRGMQRAGVDHCEVAAIWR
jgi:hypothetical protein